MALRQFQTLLIKSCFLKRSIPIQRQWKNLVLDLKKHWDDQLPQVHLLDVKPSQTVELTKENGLKLYKNMDFIRAAENGCATLYRSKKIRGFCHLYIGQEAVAVGIHSVLSPQDTVITSYRCHGWLLLYDDNLVGFFAELLGRSTGIARGKGGSMHLYAKNFFGGNGIVGAHVPLGVGIALKHKYNNSDAISVTTFGDGAFPQGQVSEAFNLSKLHNLPVLFVVENNFYGLGTASDRSAANNEYYRGCTYIPGIRTNGMDILSIIEASKFALKHVRDGKGPIILEVMTYRYRGHSMSDPGTSYRGREEIDKVRAERDCLKHLAKLLTESNLATAEEIAEIKKENEKRVTDAVALAEQGPPTSLDELTSDCYSNYTGKIKVPQMLREVPYKTIAKYQ